ncbi:MAG TPA: type I-C CRISPR-associated protein Cas8c/Csd1 [Methanocorpusculum sp.]|nr:type I-C CRISPR-associated protein Cas8c/Csd1 [Methanocorpusculum sp.]
MSWVSRLCETYDNCSGDVLSADITGDTLPLLPIGHTTQYAQIEITLDDQGNFLRARALEKSEANTIIPCTEKSAGRTSGLSPHPLFDKLHYIAGDYSEYVPEKESEF